MKQPGFPAFGKPNAFFSPDGVYRYVLVRQWSKGERILAWVMLNPSTADATDDDATLRRCIGFSFDGYDSLVVLNLFSFIATNPAELEHIGPAAIGDGTDRYIESAVRHAKDVVIAWGACSTKMAQKRSVEVLALLRRVHSKPLLCLGCTSTGQPRHPLYVPKRQRFEEFLPPA